MATSFDIAPGWVDALQGYVEGLMVNSQIAAENATRFFFEKVVETAREDEDWTSMADNITLWSQDGHLHIGVNNPMFVSQAQMLEYGDAEHSPHPLFRTLTSAARDANQQMREELESKYGPNNLKLSTDGP